MTQANSRAESTAVRSSRKPSLWRRIVGPGLVMAATGVGAGDLITSLNAGASFGLTLAWAVLLGALIKFIVTESIGRWYLATGVTPLRGLLRIGRWYIGFFGVFAIFLGFFYGGAIASAGGLIVNAMAPGLPVWVAAVCFQLIGTLLVWVGRYGFFQRIMGVFVGLMFVSTVGAALAARPSLGTLLDGFTPSFGGSAGAFYVLGIIGGVGGSISLLSYSRWAAQHGWSGTSRMRAMRVDLVIGYAMTFVFMVAMMVVGAAFTAGLDGIRGVDGLRALSEPFAEEFGAVAMWLLLIGMFSAVFSSLIGGYNALCNVFTDIVHVLREQDTEIGDPEKTRPFRLYLLWMAVPSLGLLAFDAPVVIVLVYAALGAVFMPTLIAGLLYLMNSRGMPGAHRNRWFTNVAFAGGLAVYGALGVHELMGL
ncbi:divalent metal cation transporter [Streptomyces sp. RKND-216]|uniref:Nramp family divalent metal transporter n=1 Tax=Streptomyces sp. RKND-216 TaxID=2562581 RepID=UPI00109DC5E3|nr:Nramp family divalent metal transporter [Streptomyces sp. RKND-216]THA24516.1 divalent metal cation transporter [Streptomyces sp. RKND-216]